MKLCLTCEHRHNQEDWSCPVCHSKPVRHLGFLSFAPEVTADQVGFKSDYFGQLTEVEEKHFWFCSRNRLLTWALEAYFPGAQSFLEIGCGTGFVLQGLRAAFPGLQLAGSEIFCEGLLCTSKRVPNVSLFQMDARRIPFENEFDIIGAFDVLEHIQEDEIVLQQMSQAVKPGGGIIITVPQHQWLWSEMDRISGHFRRYVRTELHQKIQTAGFRVVGVTSFVSDFSVVLFCPNFMLSSEEHLMKAHKNQWFLNLLSPLIALGELRTKAHTMVSEVQTPLQ